MQGRYSPRLNQVGHTIKTDKISFSPPFHDFDTRHCFSQELCVQCRPDTSQRQLRRLPSCPLVIALVPLIYNFLLGCALPKRKGLLVSLLFQKRSIHAEQCIPMAGSPIVLIEPCIIHSLIGLDLPFCRCYQQARLKAIVDMICINSFACT